MANSKTAKSKTKATSAKTAKKSGDNPFELRPPTDPFAKAETLVHVIGDGVVCNTDTRGYATPEGRSPLEIVLDASEGFIPLWAKGTTLRWRFNERSMRYFERPTAAKEAIRRLLGEAVLKWGDAAPVKFSEKNDAWDFEIVMRRDDDCDANGCVLASAFFPDGGRHELVIYPKMFTQNKQEQLETLIHEIGHVFGLRHFFAKISETQWASEIFGVHKPFSIMNYGANSVLTADDKNDLKKLYQLAWSGQINNINGTPIKFVKPYHAFGNPSGNLFSAGQFPVLLMQGQETLYNENFQT